jgi:uncharacterized SAM-binding protein YcdF (DUF218 family)
MIDVAESFTLAPVTPREQFCAVLAAGPLLKADAIIVLCGEDAEPRVNCAVGLMQSGGAPVIVLSGGRHDPPRVRSAESLGALLMGKGAAPGRIIVENGSQHTHEQAVNVIEIAKTNAWTTLLLVASPYHTVRAMLTFIRVLDVEKLLAKVRVINVPASATPWFSSPVAMQENRLAIYTTELAKIERYHARQQCVSYEQGLEYLRYWEGR